LILHYADPWLSDKDIDAGERWSVEVGKELEASNFGVICLTRENISAEWILFEAGALSKALQTGSVCPYLLDVEFRDITGPLAQFQAKKAERGQTLELLEAINVKSQTPVDSQRLRELFDVLWPKLEERLSSIPTLESSQPAQRSSTNVLEDLVQVVRTFDSRLSLFEQVVTEKLRSPNSAKLSAGARFTVLRITSDFDTPQMKAGESKRFMRPVSLDGLASVSRRTGLPVKSFGVEWFMRDAETNEFIEPDALKNYFSKDGAHVIVTNISF
jgi:hypothetical protein